MENPSTKSDLELFTRQFNWDSRSTISKYFTPFFFGFIGFGTAVVTNALTRKPAISGIQRHLALVAVGVSLGLYVDQLQEQRYAKRDAALIYYMQSHPEDFPVTERVKFKDVMDSWFPRR